LLQAQSAGSLLNRFECGPMTLNSPFMIGSGRFFFRYRAYMFPVIFVAMLLLFRPQIVINETVTTLLIWLGFVVTLLGAGLRLFTIGLDYIIRGGKDGRVFASRLVTGGLYSHVRNPMYLGNILLAVGIALYGSAPLVLFTVVPFFVFFYFALMANEEDFLRHKFGQEYVDFCKRVNRLWPSFRGIGRTLSGFSFNWRRSAIKDSGTAFYTFAALALLPLWRNYYLDRQEAVAAYAPFAGVIMGILIPAYVALRVLKKKGSFHQE